MIFVDVIRIVSEKIRVFEAFDVEANLNVDLIGFEKEKINELERTKLPFEIEER
jgi:hypothetical protein